MKDSSHESRPGVEGDDMTELVHQYICMMLIVYTWYRSFIVAFKETRLYFNGDGKGLVEN